MSSSYFPFLKHMYKIEKKKKKKKWLEEGHVYRVPYIFQTNLISNLKIKGQIALLFFSLLQWLWPEVKHTSERKCRAIFRWVHQQTRPASLHHQVQ